MFHPDLFNSTAQYVSRERVIEAGHIRAIKRARAEERAARRAEKREERRQGKKGAPGRDAQGRFGRAA
ncbi:hypothetical protein DFP74_0151 [Nocardiopsis sp. Huas11]|uniref:hypothetical protein n=1 Tax=Nocardiopsis sp. Huas11 TaxID=2183912 RepID=UPI000EB2CE68|nr:hypothetical protein [Nocardiopsis sp. Huas11]RKS04591.1 hypothetical protein DFP74_0151 [Nocardiopsis sp. Huas11]